MLHTRLFFLCHHTQFSQVRPHKQFCFRSVHQFHSSPIKGHFTPHVHRPIGQIGRSACPSNTISLREFPSDRWTDVLLCQPLLLSLYFSCPSCVECSMSSNQMLWCQNDFVKVYHELMKAQVVPT